MDSAFTRRVAALLERVEDGLQQAARADTAFASEAAGHVIAAGGKRFRPGLVVTSALLGQDPNDDDIVKASLVVELTHVASLYHDDVMDEAQLRRGAPSANRRYGNSVAILIGDLLFSRASSVVATLGTDYVALQAATFARLVQGQLWETIGPAADVDRLEHYLRVVADKTGSLIATSAVFGGMVAGLSAAELDALDKFGEEIGVVFQLSDDVIDITSAVSGKTPGTDLRAGVPTLPTLLAQRSAGPGDARLMELLSRPLADEAEVGEALALLRAHPGLEEARREIGRRSELARGYLAPLPAGEARDALEAMCDAVVDRLA
ncbi:MAG: polyprenyl synthetase family protein [Propionibacteriaceae bacterium]|jgi:heptaprenyl diphosphate synthase|nr:polyprenyl synthetase family protein [Propionibacteriaceae bacterium]